MELLIEPGRAEKNYWRDLCQTGVSRKSADVIREQKDPVKRMTESAFPLGFPVFRVFHG